MSKPAETSVVGYIPALDGLRALAFLAVFFSHAAGSWTSVLKTSPPLRVLEQIARAGWAGVDVFFVLSGFLITRILLKSRGSENYYLRFYLRRTFRIFPAYFLFLSLCFFGLPLIGREAPAQGHQSIYWTYMHNWWIARWGYWDPNDGPVNHLWTLAVEEQFYLLWPWFVRRLSRTAIIQFCAFVMIVSPPARYILLECGIHSIPIYVSTVTRADSLLFGSLLAALLMNHNPLPAQRLLRAALWISIPAIATMVYIEKSLAPASLIGQVFGYSTLALFASGLIGLLSLGKLTPLRTIFEWPALRFIGRISYGGYILHLPILNAIHPYFQGRQSIFGAVTHTTAAFVVTVALASLSRFTFEQWFLDKGRQLESRAL